MERFYLARNRLTAWRAEGGCGGAGTSVSASSSADQLAGTAKTVMKPSTSARSEQRSSDSVASRFTWVATVFLPLSFLTGLLGINVAGIPGDHIPLAFWLVCGTLCVIAASWGIAVGRITSPLRRRSAPRDP
jgi:amino acid transporter